MGKPLEGTIASYAVTDGVGRIQLDDGEELRFSLKALRDMVPAIGVRVSIGATEPYPLGGRRALDISLADDQRLYEKRRKEFDKAQGEAMRGDLGRRSQEFQLPVSALKKALEQGPPAPARTSARARTAPPVAAPARTSARARTAPPVAAPARTSARARTAPPVAAPARTPAGATTRGRAHTLRRAPAPRTSSTERAGPTRPVASSATTARPATSRVTTARPAASRAPATRKRAKSTD